jgi:hypothetical protein
MFKFAGPFFPESIVLLRAAIAIIPRIPEGSKRRASMGV